MKRKKVLSLLLAGLMTTSIFVGCGKKGDDNNSNASEEVDK